MNTIKLCVLVAVMVFLAIYIVPFLVGVVGVLLMIVGAVAIARMLFRKADPELDQDRPPANRR